jgi:antitoxin Phd
VILQEIIQESRRPVRFHAGLNFNHIIVERGRRSPPMATWQLQDAKTRLSELIERAFVEGPQTITRHGAERAVILSIDDYRVLSAQRPNFKDHLLGGPRVDDISVERDRDIGRPFEF